MIKAIRSKFRRDGGFSLLEVSIATAIMAIGLAIAVPQFGKALETASQNEVKTNLLQAGMIVENERYIDEGLYPTNMPQEMIDSTVMSEFRYTYNDERTIYCIMGRTDTREKWYYGSEYTEPYVATTDNPPCTQENLGVGSKALGEAPIMSTPIVAGNNTWDFNSYDYAIATMSWAGATCAASASDPDPGYVQSIEYQSRIVNLDTGETILVNEGAWSQATGANDVSLNGWLPDDRISYETRMRCNYDYETYYDDWASTNGEVSTFPVSASLVADAPAPSIEWTSTQQYAVLSYEGTPIACPSVATPAYRPIANQSGKPTVTGQWGNTTQFDLSLTNFAPNANAEFSVESGCKVGSVYYVANGPAKTTVAGTATKVILVPAMAPAPVTGLKCVTKYNRQYESSRGNCDVDSSIAAATTTPDAVKWNYTPCASGFNVEYLVRRSSPAATAWTSAGSNSYFTFGNNSGVTPGSTVTYEVKSQCSGNGITSAESDAASISFISSWRPPTDAPLTFTWTGSIDDSSWVETTNFGDAPLNDRITGTSTLCSNNTTPYGYVVTMKNVNTGATASINLNSSNLVINRSAWSGANNVWAKGADVQMSAQAKCADPFGDYADVTTNASSYGNTVPIGYPSPAAVTQVNCVTAYQRITEVNKGNCIYDPTVASQAYTPDVIRWTAATCYSGYTPSYSMRRADTGESWTNVGNVTQAIPSTATTGANIEATYEVKYQCVNGSRKSEDSGVSSKTFISSLKPISSAPIVFTWTPSTEDSAWNNDAANNGYYFYDRFVGTAATPCSNGSQPQGYNLQIDRSGKGTPQSLNGQVIPSISRGQIANADTYWPMGAKMVVRAQAICGDPYGDYANVPSTWSAWSPEFAIAIAAPEAPSIGSNNLWGHFTWGGSGCEDVPASNLQYYATQTQYGSSYGSWHVYGWGAGTEGDVPNYSEGSAISTNTVARCVSEYGIVSPNSEPAVQSWTSGINGSTYVYMPRMHTGAVDGICRSGTWETNLRQYARSAAGINGGWFYEKEHSYTNGTWGNVYAVSGYSTCTNGSQSSFEHHGYLVGPGYPTESMDYIVY